MTITIGSEFGSHTSAATLRALYAAMLEDKTIGIIGPTYIASGGFRPRTPPLPLEEFLDPLLL